jgi:hypothetical protein
VALAKLLNSTIETDAQLGIEIEVDTDFTALSENPTDGPF